MLPTVPALLESARPPLESCRQTTAALAEIIPQDQFWRWKEMWQNSLRNAVFAATLVEYLHSGGLLPLPAVAEKLGSMLSRFTVRYYARLTCSSTARMAWQIWSTCRRLSSWGDNARERTGKLVPVFPLIRVFAFSH